MSTVRTPAIDGLELDSVREIHAVLQQRLNSLIDLALTLKHVHWNVIGPNFIAIHEMLDEHVVEVRSMSDALAERLRVLGGEPIGTPQHLVSQRTWSDYPLGRAESDLHLHALDSVYSGIILDHREAIAAAEPDPVTEDLLISQTATLEFFQWLVRSHVAKMVP